jgi:quercetin dioxygenase-like cupin family protein
MPAPDVRPFKRPDWTPWPFEGFVNVEGRVIIADETIVLALLRFGEHGKIHEHAGENEAIVSCLEGSGYTSVGGVTSPLRAGEYVVWPIGVEHGLWTDGSTMTTLMCERPQ